MRLRLSICALILVALSGVWLTVVGRADAVTPLEIGFGDSLFSSTDAETREEWVSHAANTGASIARIDVRWRSIAPQNPSAGFEPANPASSGYAWQTLDAAVRSVTDSGMKVLLTIYEAPRWAEGDDRPKSAEQGTWKPQVGAYEAFAKALATRYSGSYPDPLSPGASLPRVRYFEAWNEPNLNVYLTPQWEGRQQVGPVIYRQLVNALYAGVKSIQPDSKVVAGALAPFGDLPGGARTPPVEFLRSVLCLQGGNLFTIPCKEPAHFDILSDHPIAAGSPTQSAESPLDVSTPDLARLTKVLKRAEENNRVLPRGRKPLWVTEFWYDSNPPDPEGVPLYRQARWYEQDLYMFWKQGARVAIELQVRDSPPGKGYEYTNQSGIYFVNGEEKPSATAFRFPFVAERVGRKSVTVWGIPPRSGKVKVQERRSGNWKTVASVAAKQPRVPFSFSLPIQGEPQLRAVVGGEASLPWNLG